MTKAILVHGPQGCGKTRNAETIREHFGATEVIDGWRPGDTLKRGALHLTHMEPDNVPPVTLVVPYEHLVNRGVV